MRRWIYIVALCVFGSAAPAAGWFYWTRSRANCSAWVQKNYEVHFDWDNGLRSVRFVDVKTGTEETSNSLRRAALQAVAANVPPIIAETRLDKAEGVGYVSLQGCGEPYLTAWRGDWNVPKLSELLYAAESWNVDELRRLLNEGMNFNAHGFAGQTPLIAAASDPRRDPRMKFATPPDVGTVEFLLQKGADPNARDGSDLTPLMHADDSTAALLIAAGADVNARDGIGETPLMWAAMSRDGDLQTIKLELAAHADVNATDRSGWSALMHAAQMGNLEAVRALVTAGADREAKNKDGETALMIARKRQQGSPALQEIVAALSKTR